MINLLKHDNQISYLVSEMFTWYSFVRNHKDSFSINQIEGHVHFKSVDYSRTDARDAHRGGY